MSTVALANRWELGSAANTALKAAARLWFAATVAGQWAFLYYIVAFYGPSTLSGEFEAWGRNKFLLKGYVAGDAAGNLTFAAHALLAAVVAFGGALQLVPYLRARATSFHRWNGRLFLVTALGVSVSGLYLVWVRGARISLLGGFAISLNALLIIACAVLAWRAALRRDIPTHRRWALRVYLVANGQWFLRIGVIAWIVLNRAVGVKVGFGGPFIYFADFACYLLPLAVLELYLRLKDSPRPLGRLALAGGLLVLTAVMSVGIVGLYLFTRPLLASL
jgi:uncharacterized membrane protein